MKPRELASIVICLGVLVSTVCVAAQQPAPPPEASQFNFWIGDWDVTRPDGKPAGESHIQSINNGRSLLENWKSAKGNYVGKSLNSYDATSGKWMQFWVDSAGTVLELSGGLVDGNMVLSGTHHTKSGTEVVDRITWTPNADGSVRQHWEQSTDGGATWKTVFDGHYVRMAKRSE